MQTKSEAPTSPRPDLERVRARFGSLLGKVYRQWRRQVDLHFKDLGLSDASRAPLLALYVREEPMRQKELAAALHLDTSSLVRTLAQLQAADLVDWTNDPADKRTKCIALTPGGRATAAMLLDMSLALEQSLLSDVAPEDLATTRRVLEQIAAGLARFDAAQRPSS